MHADINWSIYLEQSTIQYEKKKKKIRQTDGGNAFGTDAKIYTQLKKILTRLKQRRREERVREVADWGREKENEIERTKERD